jgi:hypothetical protein
LNRLMGLYISNKWSSKLIEVTKDIEIVGLERSAKFSHKCLNDDRFIIGPKHGSFKEDLFLILLKKFQFPSEYLSDAVKLFYEANQIGIGFESKQQVSFYKLYFEFFNQQLVNHDIRNGTLHIGYKWKCDEPSSINITRYRYIPFFNGSNPENVIRQKMFAVNESFLKNVVLATNKVLATIEPKNRIMTYAHDENGCRNSFTVKMYKSKKKLSFIRLELEGIAKYFKISKKIVDSFFIRSGDAKLGHIAGGMNQMNDPFFTVYFDDFINLLN